MAERGLVVSKPDDLGVSGLEVRNQSIRAVVVRFRQTRILPPSFYLLGHVAFAYPSGLFRLH